MCSLCLCTLSASASIHPLIPTFGRFLFCFCSFSLRSAAHGLAVDASSAYVHQQNGIQQLIHSVPTIEELCRSYAQNKVQKHHPREFPGYWWQFRTQHFSCYGARLVEERRKKMNSSYNFDFWLFQVCPFKIVGASLSEPHTGQTASPAMFIYLYVYIYVSYVIP